jgi:Na+-translocating ferredoxin:NAD+ oxidoreductase RnfD subunit
MRISHCVYLATLVSLMLPPHLLTSTPIAGEIPWPLLPAAGLTLSLAAWLLGGIGGQRLHSSVVTIVVIFGIFHSILTPRYVLRRDRMFVGDLMKVNPASPILSGNTGWIQSPAQASAGYDAIRRDPPGDTLLAYTSAQVRPDRASVTLQMLIRDQLPPLEDLIFAGQSGAIGIASGVAVIVGGLFLLYQGVIDFRIPLFSLMSAMATILITPIPLVITDTTVVWHWLTFRPHMLGPAAGVTFMNYEIFSSPFLLTIFFLASAPGLRPLHRRGRVIFAIILGVLSALFQLYVSNALGPYVALLIVCMLTPVLDRILLPRTLV